MASVYVNNLVINAGSDFSQSFTLQDPATNSNFNLTSYTVAAQMRKWAGSGSAVTFDASREIPYSSGRISLKLNSLQTLDIKPGRYVYDVVITDQFGVKNRVVEGMVLVREGVTQ
jgi:hypothetical protein